MKDVPSKIFLKVASGIFLTVLLEYRSALTEHKSEVIHTRVQAAVKSFQNRIFKNLVDDRLDKFDILVGLQ